MSALQRNAVAAFLILTLLASGCMESGAPKDDASAPGVAGGNPLSPAPGRGASGGSTGPASGTATPPSEEETNATLEEHALSWDGALETYVCVALDLGGRSGCTEVRLEPDDDLYFPDLPSDPRRVEVTLTWTVETPLTQELTLVMGYFKSCGDDCWNPAPELAKLKGPSPIPIKVPDMPPAPDGTRFGFRVVPPSADDGGVVSGADVRARTHQAFRLEGKAYAAPAE